MSEAHLPPVRRICSHGEPTFPRLSLRVLKTGHGTAMRQHAGLPP